VVNKARVFNERGSVLSFFALLFPVLLALGGLVIDSSVVSLKKSNLSAAVDAAAWAALDSYDREIWEESNIVVLDESRALQLANEYLAKNMPEAQVTSVKVVDSNKVEVVANVKVQLFFMKLFGINEVTLTASSKAQIG
jgi:Flp pilus assembly protein TadG